MRGLKTSTITMAAGATSLHSSLLTFLVCLRVLQKKMREQTLGKGKKGDITLNKAIHQYQGGSVRLPVDVFNSPTGAASLFRAAVLAAS